MRRSGLPCVRPVPGARRGVVYAGAGGPMMAISGAVAAEGPFHLVETLAERIAARLLAHVAIVRVTVRVEKRDLGPGGIGVEIVRQRGSGGGARQ